MKIAQVFEKWDSIIYTLYNLFNKLLFIIRYSNLRKILKKNKKLKDLHLGERCFILLNGPILNNYDLTKLESEYVFCTNYFNRSEYYNTVKPNFHCAIDNNYFDVSNKPEQKKEIEELIQKYDKCKFIYNSNYLDDFEITDNVFVAYTKHLPTIFGVQNNLHSISSNFATVAIFAMNVAVYMGFKEIYLLGYDFEPGIFNHFYQEAKSELENKQRQKSETRKSVICGRYWGYTMAQYHNYYMSEFAEKNKVSIYNCNSNSYVRSFDFINYDSIFTE